MPIEEKYISPNPDVIIDHPDGESHSLREIRIVTILVRCDSNLGRGGVDIASRCTESLVAHSGEGARHGRPVRSEERTWGTATGSNHRLASPGSATASLPIAGA